ncbi:UCH-domain-containing protein [Fomitiporia mediterranea MF3/22]|uniref:UCH-domain-containing protein n=1 Tax=Fomitiporia mediterranea (strain MF3/22) TaxID=694068 RepID=UPI0004409C0A|nr:UCH-domain-containing protein [Fomitiporia mediterranea MF3/22]EJD07703.1 UCH-domain-containing protein [Fomitiporia mediterranea MF3/22]
MMDDESDSIDTYMREQGEQDLQRISLETVSAAQQPHSPSPSEKLQFIERVKNRPMIMGETWYIVSRAWYRRWERACRGEVTKQGAILENQIGPVDNSKFFEDGKFDASQSMMEGIDFEFVPSEAWNAFVQWYGETPDVIARQVVTRGQNNEPCIELRPLCVPVSRLVSDTTSSSHNPPRELTISSLAKLSDLYTKLLDILDLPRQTQFRTWAVFNLTLNEVFVTLPNFLKGNALLLPNDEDHISQTIEEAIVEQCDGFVVELLEDGRWLVDEVKVRQPGAVTPNPAEDTAPSFSSGPDFFSKFESGSSKKAGGTALGPSPPISTSSYGKGRADRKGIVPGTIGFSNMGNTCFMNSALQCLVHTQELVEYFLTRVYQGELNPDNPLGMQGAIAEAFGVVMDRVWLPQSTVYAPREFKMQLQRFAPQFSGYQQHDSQELVAFLLDGLHEDLNRVLKKPYVEKPDWNGGGDKELVALAKESWEGYKKRNDSVIVDLFQGQYRSTLVCPECKRVSITFDPFMYLTLPLPVQKKWTHPILYIPWDVSKPHVKVPVELNRNASFREVRQLLSRWMNAEPDNLLTLETFSNRFYKYLDDTVPVGDMSDADHIVCFELPCHAQQSRNWSPSADPTEDPVILPVHLCKEIPSTYSSFQRPSSGFAHPFIVVLDKEQNRDRKKIYSAIIERLERWTKHARDLYQWEEVAATEVKILETHSECSISEVKENGDVVRMDETEEDISDEKSRMFVDESIEVATVEKSIDRLGPKPDLFEIHIQSGHDKLGAGNAWSSGKWEQWEARKNAGKGDDNPPLLRRGDALYCEWDDNFRSYFFGDDPHHEHALWQDRHWGEFIHPEFKEMQEASAARSKKCITLNDCLDEFTREEELGEEDLWYCSKCKKHQPATKKFDLWTIPDILVVHLKRFSNSRILRDKIDAFVDFPVEGLDLEAFSGEREVAKRLAQEGHDVKALGVSDAEEPLLYDLYAVDEHMGGLGGGHYRAYAKNHETDKWYHFDDTHVSVADPADAVNRSAYLLFYKRRTSRAIGGVSYEKVEAARQKLLSAEEDVKEDVQLPTPPDEEEGPHLKNTLTGLLSRSANYGRGSWNEPLDGYENSPFSSRDENSAEVESDLENGSGSPFEYQSDPLAQATRSYDFPNPGSATSSPTSSNAADAGDEGTPDMDFTDLDEELAQEQEQERRGQKSNDSEIPVSGSSLHDIDY